MQVDNISLRSLSQLQPRGYIQEGKAFTLGVRLAISAETLYVNTDIAATSTLSSYSW